MRAAHIVKIITQNTNVRIFTVLNRGVVCPKCAITLTIGFSLWNPTSLGVNWGLRCPFLIRKKTEITQLNYSRMNRTDCAVNFQSLSVNMIRPSTPSLHHSVVNSEFICKLKTLTISWLDLPFCFGHSEVMSLVEEIKRTRIFWIVCPPTNIKPINLVSTNELVRCGSNVGERFDGIGNYNLFHCSVVTEILVWNKRAWFGFTIGGCYYIPFFIRQWNDLCNGSGIE